MLALEFFIPADKTRHDKLLGLLPKLRAATSDSKKAMPPNAVTATDQRIDPLVYELHGLTKAEKNLAEGDA